MIGLFSEWGSGVPENILPPHKLLSGLTPCGRGGEVLQEVQA